MDAAPDAPANSTLDERRPKGTPEEQLAALGPDPAEAAEPELDEPEEDLKAADGPALAQPSSSTPNATQPSRPPTPDFAAAPVSPPAADRNATTSARADTSQPQQSPSPSPTAASIPNHCPDRPNSPARRSASARNRADQRRDHGCRRAHRRLPTSRDTNSARDPRNIPTRNPRSASRSTVLDRAIPSEPLRGQKHPRDAARPAGSKSRRGTRLHTPYGDRPSPSARRPPGQTDHVHRRTLAAAA